MNNENQTSIIPINNLPEKVSEGIDQEQVFNIPNWVKSLESELGVSGTAVMKKQMMSTELVSEEEKADEVVGLTKLANISKGYFTEDELIFMYVVGVKNLMNLTAELKQVKQMLAFFTSFTPSEQDREIHQPDEPQQTDESVQPEPGEESQQNN